MTPIQVTFPYYAAFNSLLAKMELIKRVYVSQARGNVDLELTKEEFLLATQSYAQITPYEVCAPSFLSYFYTFLENYAQEFRGFKLRSSVGIICYFHTHNSSFAPC